MSPYDLAPVTRDVTRESHRLTHPSDPSDPTHPIQEGGKTPQTPLADIEDRIKGFCDDRVTDFVMHVWLRPLTVVTADESLVRLGAPSHMRSWVAERYGNLLVDAAAYVLGGHPVVHLVAPDWTAEGEELAALEAEAARLRRRHLAERQIHRYGDTA